MAESQTDNLKSFIDEIMRNEGETNYELNITGNGMKGDGYMGQITFVTVKTGGNSLRKNYDFVIKSANKNDKLREQTSVRRAYLREILLYNKILPLFEQFQLEYSIQKPFAKYAKCYKICVEEKKEMLVLENLKAHGFELHNRTLPMTLNHVQFVFTQYAHYHGISMALKQLKPEIFRAVTSDIDDIYVECVIKMNAVPGFKEYMRQALKLLDADQAQKFEGYELEIEKIFTKTVYDKEDPVMVILHGDCWNNNLMFKYDEMEKTKPIDVRFLDFQISRVAHPILDLSYFLYACCDEEILTKFDLLLNLYHSTLSDNLSQYGIDVNTFFPLSKLKKDWKTVGKYGMYMAIAVIQFALYDSEEAPDFEEIVNSDQEFMASVVSMIKEDERYNKRAKAILEHFIKTFL